MRVADSEWADWEAAAARGKHEAGSRQAPGQHHPYAPSPFDLASLAAAV
jgi:hypothetical protein